MSEDDLPQEVPVDPTKIGWKMAIMLALAGGGGAGIGGIGARAGTDEVIREQLTNIRLELVQQIAALRLEMVREYAPKSQVDQLRQDIRRGYSLGPAKSLTPSTNAMRRLDGSLDGEG